MASKADIPSYDKLMWPTLEAIRRLGGSARNEEIVQAVINGEGFTEEQQQVPRRPDDAMTLIEYRLHWARSYLKGLGLLDNSTRGVWSLTDRGRTITGPELPGLLRQHKREYHRAWVERKKQAAKPEGEDDTEIEEEGNEDWRSRLLKRLMQMTPDGFERLAQRLLREAGFRNVEVTGRSGDGGIDGVGDYRVSLVSFPIYFQCKRYKGSVRAPTVRDFRGAMSGRGEKGLLITTGRFTPDARAEATRDGAPPVELISGDDLCDLLREHNLGVRTKTVEVHEVDPGFFDQF
jgi:restriction system protein